MLVACCVNVAFCVKSWGECVNTGCLISAGRASATFRSGSSLRAARDVSRVRRRRSALLTTTRRGHGRLAFAARVRSGTMRSHAVARGTAAHEDSMRKLLIIVLIIIGIPVIWFWVSFPTVSYRYRLTVAVECDGQVHSGSSVIEVLLRFNPKWLPPSGGTYNVFVTGQAVLIDLGARGVLVAALGGNPYDLSVVNA